MVPSTVVKPRDGSFALASFGRVRKVQERAFTVAAGRKSFALKRILEAVLVIFLVSLIENLRFGALDCNPVSHAPGWASPNHLRTQFV
jgi:hypothetical protein